MTRKKSETIERVVLTRRQHQAAMLVARGRTIEQVAETLDCSFATAKHTIARVRQLLGVARTRDIHDRLDALEGVGGLEVTR